MVYNPFGIPYLDGENHLHPEYFPPGFGGAGYPVTSVGSVASYALTFPASGNIAYDFTLGQTLTLTIGGGVAGNWQQMTIILRQPSGGGVTVNLPTAFYAGGSAPTVGTGANAITVITFGTDDGGVTIFGGL